MRKTLLTLLAMSIIYLPLFSSKEQVDARKNDIKRKVVHLNVDENQFISDCDSLGFTIGGNWEPYSNYNDTFLYNKYEYKERNTLNHFTDCYEIILKNKYSSTDYAYLYRISTSPMQVRNWGFLGIGSHSDDWFFNSLVSECQLSDGQKLLNFSPTNSPMTGSSTMGISVGKEAALECSVSYNLSELKTVSESNYALNKFCAKYIDPYCSNYTGNSATFYGMFTFRTEGKPHISVSHKVLYYGLSYYHENSSAGTAILTRTY